MRLALAAAGVVTGLLLSAPAEAAPELKSMHGVWSGTIGTFPVHACYEASEYSNDGKYFYRRRLSTIPLEADENKPAELTEGWADSRHVARWRMTSIDQHRAEGTWTGNGRTLPIRLTRLSFAPDSEFDSPCGSLAFVDPIFAATRIVKSPALVNGLAIQKWSLAYPDESISVASFQLAGGDPAIAAINRRLRKPFDKADDGWRWCVRNAGSFGASYDDEITISFATARWLSVMARNESFCGGAHPNNSNQPILFDRKSGNVADLYGWFGRTSSNREKVEGFSETIDSPTGRLLDLVLKLHPRASESEEDCGGAVRTASSWTLELKRGGIAFTPDLPRVVMACGDEVVVPWARLTPFLSPSGRKEVAAIRAERGR